METSKKDLIIGYSCIVIATVLFSTMEIALKTIASDFHPMQTTFLRFFPCGVLFLPFALLILKKKNIKIDLKSLGYFALLGFLCVVISMTFFQLAILNANASLVAVLFSSNPLFVLVLAYFILREPIFKRNVVALVLAIVGIIFIADPFHADMNLKGLMFSIAATVFFALYGVLSKRKNAQYGSFPVTAFGFFFGSIELLILIGLGKIPAIASLLSNMGLSFMANIPIVQGITLDVLPTLLYTTFGVTGIAYVAYFMAMEKTSASTTSLVFFFKPVLASVLAFFILHESIPLYMVIGIILILAGSLATILPDLLQMRNASSQTNVKKEKDLGKDVEKDVEKDFEKEKENYIDCPENV